MKGARGYRWVAGVLTDGLPRFSWKLGLLGVRHEALRSGAFQSSSDVAPQPSRFCVPWADYAEHFPVAAGWFCS
jgi:hypothetical protein